MERRKSMENKLAITVALAGAGTRRGSEKGMTPYVPITPDEMAEEAKRCYDAGASIVHIHARDPKTTFPTADLGIFSEIVEKIRARCPIVINLSTGGNPDQTAEQVLAPIPALKPDMASFTSGSFSSGYYIKKEKKFLIDYPKVVNFAEMVQFASTMKENGVKPECEIYGLPMLSNIKIIEEDFFVKPVHLQFVMGMRGQVTPCTPRNLMNLVDSARDMFDSFTWSICAVGLDEWPMITLGAIMGANSIRAGMEDNIYLEPGVLAKSNAELVEKAVKLAQGVGRRIATVDETRKILNLGA
jgi:uncharacterized protein (DUF849 family)